MSSSYAAAISALSSDSSVEPPAKTQTSPETTGVFCPSSKSIPKPPGGRTPSQELLRCLEEQQEDPADYGIGEHRHGNLKYSCLKTTWTEKTSILAGLDCWVNLERVALCALNRKMFSWTL